MDFVIHKNKISWGTVWHIITDDGMGHVEAQIDNDNPNTLFVSGLSVYEAARRRGLATTMLHEIETLAIDNDIERIRLNVNKPKSWVYDFYIRHGYEFWDEDEDDYYLVKYV